MAKVNMTAQAFAINVNSCIGLTTDDGFQSPHFGEAIIVTACYCTRAGFPEVGLPRSTASEPVRDRVGPVWGLAVNAGASLCLGFRGSPVPQFLQA
jgi:hypothetical protein